MKSDKRATVKNPLRYFNERAPDANLSGGYLPVINAAARWETNWTRRPMLWPVRCLAARGGVGWKLPVSRRTVSRLRE